MTQPIPRCDIGPLLEAPKSKRRKTYLDIPTSEESDSFLTGAHEDDSSDDLDSVSGAFSFNIFESKNKTAAPEFPTPPENEMSVYTNIIDIQDDIEPLLLSGSTPPTCKFESLQAYTFSSVKAP